MLFCRITPMDSYSTDYYDISYPGLIMKVPWASIPFLHSMLFSSKSLSLWIKSFAATPDPPADVSCGADLHPLHCLCHYCLALPLCSSRVCARTGRFVLNNFSNLKLKTTLKMFCNDQFRWGWAWPPCSPLLPCLAQWVQNTYSLTIAVIMFFPGSRFKMMWKIICSLFICGCCVILWLSIYTKSLFVP